MPPTLSRLLTALLLVSLPLATALGFAQGPGPLSASGLDLAAIDRSIDPCANFYQFACGEWVAKNPIPPDRPSWGRFNALQDRNNDILRRVLDTAVSTPTPGTQQIGDYYASCMDEPGIEQKGATPLGDIFPQIDALRDTAGLAALVAGLHASGANVFFQFGSEGDPKDARSNMAGVAQGGLGLPDRDYYFREDQKSADLRTQYTGHIAAMLVLTGASQASATTAAAAVMRIETALASAAYDAVSRRDPVKNYHRMTPADLQALTPAFDWTTYLRSAGAPAIRAIDVAEPDFMKNLNRVITSTPVDDIRTYLKWQLTRSAAPLLSTPFVNENFRFYGRTLQGSQELRPRWRRCVQFTDRDLGEALGQAFVRDAFAAQAKTGTLKMVRGIEAALEQDITRLDWMTDATRKQALAKLHNVSNKIGYPDRWRDYRTLRIVRGDALGNKRRAAAFEFRRDLSHIGKPVDKGEWGMTPPTVNAYYDPSQNNINFPAGILQPPFFSAATDPAVNYGGAGSVIGHELTHGFDDEGRQFDAKGNLNDWWTPADAKAFEERASCLVNQYSSYTAVDDVKLNGKLTLGENTADNGGVRMALLAYLTSDAGHEARPLDGFTPEQRFFLGFGQIWCESRRPEYERQLARTDPHSPGRHRVNGVVSNMPEFQKAFSCKADAPMVPAKACRVW
jgi:putative endopeptidase